MQGFMFIRFCKAVLAGSFTAAAMPLFFAILLTLRSLPDGGINGPGSIGASLYLAILPLLVTTPIVLLASILIGLPLALFLRRSGRESTFAYCAAGGIAGFVIPSAGLLLLGLDALGCFLMGGLGMVSGAMTGYVWSRPAKRPIPRPDT
ncbi:hypothetical protein [uncultured Sphingomonas sp.]|uniref:hypothetical protein n=1 Tax=uncultured Sphingomonas sp. TaxID=158754 RepID=UPI0025CD72A7|nr:hypothetical protein [uncultured Sphingomonas sp.]